jgi:hypothetical protein
MLVEMQILVISELLVVRVRVRVEQKHGVLLLYWYCSFSWRVKIFTAIRSTHLSCVAHAPSFDNESADVGHDDVRCRRHVAVHLEHAHLWL